MTEKQKLLRNLKSISIKDRAVLEELFNLTGDKSDDGTTETDSYKIISKTQVTGFIDPIGNIADNVADKYILETELELEIIKSGIQNINLPIPNELESVYIGRTWYTGEGYVYEVDEFATIPINHIGVISETDSYLIIMGVLHDTIMYNVTDDIIGSKMKLKICYELYDTHGIEPNGSISQ